MVHRDHGRGPLRWVILAAAMLLLPRGGSAAVRVALVRVAPVELHNVAGEFLPRIGEYSEERLGEVLGEIPGVENVGGRAEVSQALIDLRLSVTAFVDDPAQVVDLARELAADYLVTGTIHSFVQDGPHRHMDVDLILLDGTTGKPVFSQGYTVSWERDSDQKLHRELLDAVLEEARDDLAAALGLPPTR